MNTGKQDSMIEEYLGKRVVAKVIQPSEDRYVCSKCTFEVPLCMDIPCTSYARKDKRNVYFVEVKDPQ